MTAPETPIQASGISASNRFDPRIERRHKVDRIFEIATWVATLVGLVVLALLLADVLHDGLSRLFSANFLDSYASRKPEEAGVKAALSGTLWIIVTTAVICFPIGVGAGIFLEEFATENPIARLIEINISNLAAVPSVIYGLFGLGFFAQLLRFVTGGRSILSAAMTLSLLILPIVIVATREALRSVPDSLRQAGFALGATRWQVVREHVFPLALPGILTGTILALSRAIGETAPLLVIGALAFVRTVPTSLQSKFSALPVQIHNWASRPQEDFHNTAAAGIIVLMVVLLCMNAVAVFLRNKYQRER